MWQNFQFTNQSSTSFAKWTRHGIIFMRKYRRIYLPSVSVVSYMWVNRPSWSGGFLFKTLTLIVTLILFPLTDCIFGSALSNMFLLCVYMFLCFTYDFNLLIHDTLPLFISIFSIFWTLPVHLKQRQNCEICHCPTVCNACFCCVCVVKTGMNIRILPTKWNDCERWEEKLSRRRVRESGRRVKLTDWHYVLCSAAVIAVFSENYCLLPVH